VPEPKAERPSMPGYGLPGPDEGNGLLSWSWAQETFASSRNHWVVSLWAGRASARDTGVGGVGRHQRLVQQWWPVQEGAQPVGRSARVFGMREENFSGSPPAGCSATGPLTSPSWCPRWQRR